MLQTIQDLLIAGMISIAASVWGIVHYKLKKDEQNKLYKLRDREQNRLDRETSMQVEAHNVKVDYLRELVTQNRLEITSSGEFREKKGA